VNTAAGERVFHVEVDDRQQTYVRFGLDGVVGVQPLDGTEITVAVSYTAGAISPAYGSPFSFEYIGSPAEASLDLKMDALLQAGQNPLDMSVLRDLARYPSVYDDNAVFLGEFDYVVAAPILHASIPFCLERSTRGTGARRQPGQHQRVVRRLPFQWRRGGCR